MHSNGNSPQQVQFTRLPISIPCPVMVVPGTPLTVDDKGDTLGENVRTERCHVQAHWAIGSAICCDVHARQASELLGIDFDEVASHYAQCACESVPWDERQRYPQEQSAPPDHL